MASSPDNRYIPPMPGPQVLTTQGSRGGGIHGQGGRFDGQG
ncbi:hypothetical protein E3A20_21770 [Planctomyces bekefii]|uniref:Uncharacterized protein n=1 Tax=Planctomyces bekefii TaxID=1653850 RepID=A0A5C6M3J5_9PLAN|nr:hypothetical protein E3A20_21770 [Planctomyces bekefii]